MKLKIIYFGVLLVLLFLFWIAFADDAEFEGEGETVWPVENKDIEMVAETVMVQQAEIGWDATCIFVLRNTGKKTKMQVGFPDMVNESRDLDMEKGTIRNFKCYVDGKEVRVEHKQGVQNPLNPEHKYPYVYVWKMSFKKGQERVIKNTYNFRGLFRTDGTTELAYVLVTGSLWKGKVGIADIVFDLGMYNPNFAKSIEPSEYLIEGNKIHWTWADFEPTANVIIKLGSILNEWYGEVTEFGESDSVEILERLLQKSEWLWERGYARGSVEGFNSKTEVLIDRLANFKDVAKYREMLSTRRKEVKIELGSRKCVSLLRIMERMEDLSLVDIDGLLRCLDISEGLENYALAKSTAEFLLTVVKVKMKNIHDIPDSSARAAQSTKLNNLRSTLIEKLRGYNSKLGINEVKQKY